VACNSETLHVKDAEEGATLAEREALEWASKAENTTVLASAREDTKGLTRRLPFLRMTFRRSVGHGKHRAQIEVLTLLQTWGSELCPAINSPPRGKHHLSEGMQLATLRHTEMVRELAAFWEAVSSVAESVLRCSLGDIARAEAVGELVTKFQQV
jgi:hypothetical protein